jgi:membrane associated rhomboid family serine protease
MFFPFRDDNPTVRPPIVTVATIALCVLVYLYQLGLGEQAEELLILGFGMIPAVLFGYERLPAAIPTVSPWLTILSSMFLHGGFLHLLGNMLYLWVFGNNVEDAMGHARFTVFYVVWGVAAALSQALIEPESTIPMIGASGAISGVLGAYIVLHPHARVQVLFFYGLVTVINLPASVVLGWWAAVQVISLLLAEPGQGGVAWYAHLGGFIAGAALVPFFRRRDDPPPLLSRGHDAAPGPWRRGPWG